MTPTLSDIESLALRAGEILRADFNPRPGFGHQLQVDHKGEIDLVTDVDRRSEAFILEEIQRRFPSSRVLAEESGAQTGDECCIWYIDPLDGTVNYAHGVPIFCVSIAYQENGLLRLGAVYDPLREELFSAEAGNGAALNGEPIRIAGETDLDQALLITGFPYDVRENPENNLNNFTNFALKTQGVRRLGSAALDLCYVAAGRFDGFWEIRLNAWDVAAGGLIAREAGATVTDISGGLDFLSQPQSILAANPRLHPQMQAVLNGKK